MNSEIPPIRESDNANFDAESSDIRSDRLPIDTTSDEIVDIWAEEEVSDSTDTEDESNLSEVAFEPEAIESDTDSSEISTESEDAESELETESLSSNRLPELFVDSWLDEPKSDDADDADDADDVDSQLTTAQDEIATLEQQKANLNREINELKAHKEQMLLGQVREVQENMGRMVEEGTKELKERKMALQIEIEKLERRQQRINQEMRSNFAGSSQELAVRVQGFKDYLVGSLQDLATAAEKLELATPPEPAPRRREPARSRDPRRDDRRGRRREESPRAREGNRTLGTQFSEPAFAAQNRRIRQLIDNYRNNPDYYGSPWQLRRTFAENQAQRVQEWFLVQGGRGAVDSMGSRLQNILVASAAISILHNLYGDRCKVLVLTDTPENLGEWRKGLEDCLGISRRDFGANRGVVLFDSPNVLVQRAERLVADKLLPIIIIDETEELLNLAILKFPIWLAFASTNKSAASNYSY